MSAELRLKKLRGSGGFVMARVSDEQQSKGNLGGPDLFLAPVGRLEAEKISKYTCNTCEKEFEGSPNIEFENPNEEVAENLILVERGKYLCNECGSTIAEYRDFRKPNEQVEVGLANPVADALEKITPPNDIGFSDFDTFTEQETETVQAAPETSSSGDTFRSIFGMDVFDESAKRIGKAKQVGVNANQELVLVVSDVSGNDINISWSRIGTVGEVIFLGKSDNTETKVESTPIGEGLRCPSCNFDNKPDSKFCESCGTQL